MKEDVRLSCEEVALDVLVSVLSNSDKSLVTWKGCSEIGLVRLELVRSLLSSIWSQNL